MTENRFPIEDVRAQFPALEITDDGRPRAYLDNPAGTQVPQATVDAVSRCLIESNANLGGFFPTTQAAEAVVEEAHAGMADFLNAASSREVIIGLNMTTLTYQMSRSLGHLIGPGDEIIVTRMDHEGNIAPWLQLAEDRGAVVRWLDFDRDTYEFAPEALDPLLTRRTKLLALNHASNLIGTINDVKGLAAKAKAAGALVYVDSVQYAPHGPIDVQDLGCDFLACSAYKFFGPHLGVLWGREALLAELPAYKVRAVGDDLPDKFESGTPNIEGMAGLNGTLAYLDWLAERTTGEAHRAPYGHMRGRGQAMHAAIDVFAEYERDLTARLIQGLQGIPGLKVHGITNEADLARRVPTVSFTLGGVAPREIAKQLAAENLFVWSSHNYALELVRHLGIDETEGVVRIGLAHYNTLEEIERLLAVLDRHYASA